MRWTCLYIALCVFALKTSAQDLNARVTVLSPKIQTTNKRIFQSLETAMKDFLNGRKWLNDPLLSQERIECSFVVNITNWDGSSSFNAELQVQSTRPVFNSNYTTGLLNINDKDFDFNYTEGQTIDYSDQNFQSNLASVMAFYAYIIAGVDNDSFSRLGGTSYYARAQNVLTIAQASSYRGWKAFDSNTNRYWLIENLNNKVYEPLRVFIYDYHRNGMDVMADNVSKARKAINSFLPVLADVDRQRLGTMLPLVFFAAKSDELVNLYATAPAQERVQALNILMKADPSNGIKYQVLQK
ncbi:type IX secretion system protein PorD [Mucilaginibacter sp. HD30]